MKLKKSPIFAPNLQNIVQLFGLISRFKGRLAGLLLLILSAYYVNTSMCYHSHKMDGETIFHSHFYSGDHDNSSEGDGGHTVAIIKLIAALSNFAIEEQGFDSHIASVEPILEAILLVASTAAAKYYIERSRALRAPPTL